MQSTRPRVVGSRKSRGASPQVFQGERQTSVDAGNDTRDGMHRPTWRITLPVVVAAGSDSRRPLRRSVPAPASTVRGWPGDSGASAVQLGAVPPVSPVVERSRVAPRSAVALEVSVSLEVTEIRGPPADYRQPSAGEAAPAPRDHSQSGVVAQSWAVVVQVETNLDTSMGSPLGLGSVGSASRQPWPLRPSGPSDRGDRASS